MERFQHKTNRKNFCIQSDIQVEKEALFEWNVGNDNNTNDDNDNDDDENDDDNNTYDSDDKDDEDDDDDDTGPRISTPS